MASGSVSFKLGTGEVGLNASDFTFGTQVPNADDFEFRWNLTDAVNSNVIRRLDIIKALKTMIAIFESNGVYTTLSEG